jgi:hypothetical protein
VGPHGIRFDFNQGALVSSSKRFYVRFSVEVWDLDDAGTPTSVLSHEYDARGRDVLIQFPVGTLGDIMAWFSYAPASPKCMAAS